MLRRSFKANAKQFDVVSLHVIVFMRLLDACIYDFPASSFVCFSAAVGITLLSRK